MIRSRLVLAVSLVLLNLAVAASAYQIGRRVQKNHHASGVYYVQASLAFGHYKEYGIVADFLEKKCYEDALTQAKYMRDLQISLVAENLRRTGYDPTLLEYIKLRDPELLKSVSVGHRPEPPGPIRTTCR